MLEGQTVVVIDQNGKQIEVPLTVNGEVLCAHSSNGGIYVFLRKHVTMIYSVKNDYPLEKT